MLKNLLAAFDRIWNPWPLNPVKIPDEAFAVAAGTDEEKDKLGPYMWVWDEGVGVFFVFRNMPWAKVRFDKRAVPGLIKALEKVNDEPA
jgi:hypothetical protein